MPFYRQTAFYRDYHNNANGKKTGDSDSLAVSPVFYYFHFGIVAITQLEKLPFSG
jgi:hypothetical protein